MLAVAEACEGRWMYELRPTLLRTGRLSPARLVATVRTHAEPAVAGCER